MAKTIILCIGMFACRIQCRLPWSAAASVNKAKCSVCSSDPPITMTQHDTAGPLLPAVFLFRINQFYLSSCFLGCPALSPLPLGKSPGGWRRLRDG